MGFDYLRPPIGETIFNSKGIINEVWNAFFTEIVGVEQFKYLEGIVAGNISVGDAIASTDYAAGTKGWRIATDNGIGVAEFNIPIVAYANVTGTKPPTNADSTATTIEGGLVTTGTLSVVQGGTAAAGITGNTAGDTAVRFWAGSTFENRAVAPFRVLQNGVIYVNTSMYLESELTGKIYFVDTDNVMYGSSVTGVKWLQLNSGTTYARIGNASGITLKAYGVAGNVVIESDANDVSIDAGDDVSISADDTILFQYNGTNKVLMDISVPNFFPATSGTGTLGRDSNFWDELFAYNHVFPADSAVSQSSDANTLDDYEEGTYTAALTCNTGTATVSTSYNTLAYTKIGRKVSVTGEIRLSAVSSAPTPSGSLALNLPVAIANASQVCGYFTGSVSYYDLNALTAAGTLSLYAATGTSVYLMEDSTTSRSYTVADHLKATTILTFGFTYTASS